MALHWIRSSANTWIQFVASRVSEIQAFTDPKDWRPCPGEENPADLLTGGLLPAKLVNNTTWWSGPNWILCEEEYWPSRVETAHQVADSKAEEKKVVILRLTPPPLSHLGEVRPVNQGDPCNFSGFFFFKNCIESPDRRSGPQSSEELVEAESYLPADHRLDRKPDACARAKKLTKNRVRNFSPFLDTNGLVRVGGRLQYSENSESVRHPVILPAAHPFGTLLFAGEHRRLLHDGV